MAISDVLLDRSTIVALAIAGAGISMLANALLHRCSGTRDRTARRLLRAGYAITGVSVLLFIIAGFMSNR